VALAVLAPAVPLVVALLARRHPPWVPDLDLALTELRVRDVGGAHTPLIGLPGRIGPPQRQGSHPGPLGFYLLAPGYRLLGSTVFALQASTVLVHLTAVGATIGLVVRRLGARWALAVGLALAGLVAALGPNLFTEPWNPHLPVLWWSAFLAAAWCVLCGDAPALPVLVLAGAVCAQSHLSYLGPVGVITVVAVVVGIAWPGDEPARHRFRWLGGAALLGVVLWAPPALDQLRHDPGNASLLADPLLDPPEAPIGLREGGRLVLERLDVAHLVRSAAVDPGRLADSYPEGASAARGGLLLTVALAVGAAAWGSARRPLRAAQGLAAVALLLGVTSAARIFGYPWSYLLLWGWADGLLLLLVTIAGVPVATSAVRARVAWRRDGPVAGARAQGALVGLLGVLLVATSARASVRAAGASATNPVVSRTVRALLPGVLEGLAPGERYLVTWADSIHLGGHGYGMVDELERHGVAVAVADDLATQFGRHRTVRGGDPVAGHLVVATGRGRSTVAAEPGARVLAQVDVRTAAERAEQAAVHDELVAVLQDAGLDELVPAVDDNLLGVAFDPRLPAAARSLVARLDALGAPAAVYLVPPG
jgi:hypothetical protein